MQKNIYSFALYVLIGSAFTSFAFGSNTACLRYYKSRVLKTKLNSPSGILPVFKLLHLEPAEIGSDGLYYINPSTMVWGKISNGEIIINQQQPSETSVEGVLKLKVKSANSSLSTVLHGETIDITNRISVNGEENSNALGMTTRLRIRASSSNPNQIHTLVLKNDAGQTEISFKAPKRPSDIEINLPQTYRSSSETVKIALKWKSDSPFELKLFGPIVLERDISTPGLARSFALGVIPDKPIRSNGSLSPKVVAIKAIENLFDRTKIERTLNLAQQGIEAVSRKLTEYGIKKEVPFLEKNEAGTFFFLSELNFFGDRGFGVPPKTYFHYPIEIGDFALEHGRWTHGLQLITILDGMTKEEIKTFLFEVYAPIFSQNTNLWVFWDILADSPGDSIPSAPLWWRKQLEENKILL